MKKIFSLLLAFVLVFAFAGCANDTSDDKTENKDDVSASSNPVATIVVKDYGTIKAELYYDKAPNTVENFISLANKGFYNGLTFHRVISGFMIQGGCPEGTGTGGPGYAIKGEFAINNFETNDISHVRGVISMARNSISYDSAGSQFFIMHQDALYLDQQYAAFGMVLEGMDVVDEIAAVNTNSNDKPLEDVIIESVSVDTAGVTYDEPETMQDLT